MDIEEKAGLLEAGWQVISGAPFHFIAACLIATGIIYAIFQLLHSATLTSKDSTIETLRERLQWTEKQRDSYKSELAGFKSEYEDVKDNAPRKLHQKALTLVAEIRTFLDRVRRETDLLSIPEYHQMQSAKNEDEKATLWNRFAEVLNRRTGEAASEFDRNYKVPAIVMRDELLTHLPEYTPSKHVHYEHPTNPIGMGMIADDLERMARQLDIN